MSEMHWYGAEVHTKVLELVAERLDLAARALRDYIREMLSVPNAVLKTNRAGKTRVVAGSRGSIPSQPGEYPKKLTGHLRRNVQAETDRAACVALVGTNVLYGKYLELGTRKMKPRPWLSRAVREFSARLREILEGGQR